MKYFLTIFGITSLCVHLVYKNSSYAKAPSKNEKFQNIYMTKFNTYSDGMAEESRFHASRQDKVVKVLKKRIFNLIAHNNTKTEAFEYLESYMKKNKSLFQEDELVDLYVSLSTGEENLRAISKIRNENPTRYLQMNSCYTFDYLLKNKVELRHSSQQYIQDMYLKCVNSLQKMGDSSKIADQTVKYYSVINETLD